MVDNSDSMKEQTGSLLRQEGVRARREVKERIKGEMRDMIFDRGPEEGAYDIAKPTPTPKSPIPRFTNQQLKDESQATIPEHISDHERTIRIQLRDREPNLMKTTVGDFALEGQDPLMDDSPESFLLAIDNNGDPANRRRYEIWQQGAGFGSPVSVDESGKLEIPVIPYTELAPEQLGELSRVMGDVSMALAERG